MTDLHTIEDLYTSYQTAKAALTEVEAAINGLQNSIEALNRSSLNFKSCPATDGDYVKAPDGRFVFVESQRFKLTSLTGAPIGDNEWIKLDESTRRIKEAAAEYLSLSQRLKEIEAEVEVLAKEADAALEAFEDRIAGLPKGDTHILSDSLVLCVFGCQGSFGWRMRSVI